MPSRGLRPSREAPDAYFTIKNPGITQTAYADLLNPFAPAQPIVIQFTTPTVFCRHGKSVLFSEPQLVFGSLLNRWNAYSPIKIGETLGDRFSDLLVSAYHLKTRMVTFRQYKLIGFVGFARYPGGLFGARPAPHLRPWQIRGIRRCGLQSHHGHGRLYPRRS